MLDDGEYHFGDTDTLKIRFLTPVNDAVLESHSPDTNTTNDHDDVRQGIHTAALLVVSTSNSRGCHKFCHSTEIDGYAK